jgi:hypothetical protein
LTASDVIVGQLVTVTNPRVHNRVHVLTGLVGMTKAKCVTEFVKSNALDVSN